MPAPYKYSVLDPNNQSRLIYSEGVVGMSELAELLEVSRATVGNWVLRYADFPAPLAELACGRIYYWPDVKEWRDGIR